MGITPNQMLDMTKHLEKELKKAKTMIVKVGLPKENTTKEIYKGGLSVFDIGAFAEYGQGVMHRSFLRVPHTIKRNEIAKAIDFQFDRVRNGTAVEDALGNVGAIARNISVRAFTNQGYGTWADIQQETKDRKGSSQVLIDTQTLRNSLTWYVTNANS